MGNPALEEFFGRPETIERLSEALQQASTGLNELKGALDAEVSGLVPSSWEGHAASAFVQHWRQQSTMTAQLSQQIGQTSRVMRVLASELRAALTEFQSAELAADVNRCYITPAYVVLPDSPLDLAADAAVPFIEGLVVASMAMAEAARLQASVEVAAIWAEGAALSFLKELTSFVEMEARELTTVTGAISGGLKGLKYTAKWMKYGRLGRFAPNVQGRIGVDGKLLGGRFISPKDLSYWDIFWKSMDDKNWMAHPYQSASRGTWGTVGKWAGHGGVALTFSLAAIKQWMMDHNNGNLSTSARVTRAVTRGAAAGGGAWLGGLVGAKFGMGVGAVVGMAIGGPPGAAVGAGVGAIVGGFLGGLYGSKLGNLVADKTVDFAGKVADKTVGFAGKVADGATQSFSDLRHGLESWNLSSSRGHMLAPL